MFYLTENSFLPIFIPLGFIGAYRWRWYIVKLIAYFLYRPIKPSSSPKYRSKDVTILVPTIDNGEETKAAVRSWLANDPYEIIFITTDLFLNAKLDSAFYKQVNRYYDPR